MIGSQVAPFDSGYILFQEALDDHRLGFFLTHAECPELHQLLVIDPADRRFMDDLGIHMFRVDP